MAAIYGWFGYNLPMIERYHQIRQAGFDGTLLWWEGTYCSDFCLQPDMARSEGLVVENSIPDKMTYPQILPVLYQKMQSQLMRQNSPGDESVKRRRSR